jgi:signal-transduction protein with cAMP-binding, CBS, and nucleotidyltransferase domain
MPDGSEFKQVLSMRDGHIVERYIDDRKEEVMMPEDTELEEVGIEGEEEGASSMMVNVEAAALAKIPLFSSITPNHRKLLAFSSKRINFEPGQNLIDEGVLGQFAYVILDGEADIAIGSGKSEKIIAQRGKNELIGELSLLTEALTTATVRAKTPLTALRIEKKVFLELMEGDGRVASQVASWVSNKLVSSIQDQSKAK